MRDVMLFHEPPDGGVAENVLQLASGLARWGWRPTVIGPQRSMIQDALDERGVEYLGLRDLARGYSRPDLDARVVRALRSLLRSRRPAVLHCHSSKAGVLGRVAAGAARVPAVYSPHCFGFVGDVSAGRRLLALGTERAMRGLTGAIICACEDERRRALRHHLAATGDLHRVYYGVPGCSGDRDGVDPELLAFRAEGPLFGAVAALRDQKRLDLFLDAVPQVLAQVPGARAVLVGDGPLRPVLEQQADRLGLTADERFAFLPFRWPSSRFLHALDVFVLPSAWEAMPIGVLEALACGVPQVATAVAGTPEAVSEQTGILIPPNDSRALAGAVIALLQDDERRRAAAAASTRRHGELFSLDRMVRETAAVYDAVAGRS